MLLEPTPELAARLRTYVRRRVADPHAAEDVTQDVLLGVHQRSRQLRDPGAIEAWAFRVAHNAIIDHRRAQPPELPTDVLALMERRGDEPDGDDDGDVLAHLVRCVPILVGHLTPADRQALELCDLGDLTQAQAAAQLGLTVSGMKARVQRARRRLRDSVLACCHIALDARNHPIHYEPGPKCRCGAA